MKKQLLWIVLFLICVGTVIADTSERQLPTTANKGSTFTVTYKAIGNTRPNTLLVSDVISGGCAAAGLTEIKDLVILKAGSTTDSVTYTVTTPNSDANCVFTGHYAFGDAANVNYPTATVIVGGTTCPSGQILCGTPPTCQTTCGVCTPAQTESCTVGSCAGTKTCSGLGNWGDCVKTVSSCGVTCTSGQTTTCTVDTCDGTKTCSNNAWGTCVKTVPTCGGSTSDLCTFTSFASSVFPDCNTRLAVLGIGAVVILLLIFKK